MFLKVRTPCFLKVNYTVAITFRDDGMSRSMLVMSFSMPSAILLSPLASLLSRVAWFSKPFTWAEV